MIGAIGVLGFGAGKKFNTFIIRKAPKAHGKQQQVEGPLLKKGDRVVTSGGMFATIFAIDEERNRVVLKIGDDTKMEFLKSSIAGKVDK